MEKNMKNGNGAYVEAHKGYLTACLYLLEIYLRCPVPKLYRECKTMMLTFPWAPI